MAEGLRVRDLSVAYGDKRVVDGIGFEVDAGRCLGVIGESGAGKSQAILALLGLAGARAQVQGDAHLDGENLMASASRLRGRRVAMIFQDPLTSLTPHLRIGEQIAETLVTHRGLTQSQALTRAGELLAQVDIGDVPRRLRQYPHELSGGMRQRVMIAMALACDPQLLIADEPTTALDVSVQAQLLALLRQLLRARGMAMIVVTHDMGVISALADDVLVMRAGRIVERGPVTRLLQAPEHEYTRSLLAAVPRMDDPCTSDAGLATQASDAVLRVQAVAVEHRSRTATLTSRRAHTLRAVDGVSFSVARGEALGIVGESGCGKSSLARALLRLKDVAQGEIVWLGQPVQHLPPAELRPLRSGLQMVFQDPVASLDPQMSVADIVAEPLQALRPQLDRAQRMARVHTMLESVGLGAQFAQRRGGTLSGGQCQRVAIARAMVIEPQLLVCDEAVSSLDVSIQAQLLELFAAIKRRGTGIVFVSHNLAVVRRLCERVLVMYLGRVVEAGATEAVFRDPRHPYTRMLLEAVPLLDPARERARLDTMIAAAGPAQAEAAPARTPGCAFHARCPAAQATCASTRPETEVVAEAHEVACLRWRDIVKSV